MARLAPQRRSRDPITGIEPDHDIRRLLKPDRHPRTGKQRKGFEKLEAAEAEDAERVRLLSEAADQLDGSPKCQQRLRTLIDRIRHADYEHGTGTLASATNMRALRVRTLAVLFRDLGNHQNNDLQAITIMNRHWRMSVADLMNYDPKRLVGHFKIHLNRAGIRPVDGFIIGFVHGEYDGRDKSIQLHIHAITDHQTAARIQKLSGRKGYDVLPSGARPIRRQQLKDRPRQLSYLLQSFWPNRTTYVGADGKLKRRRDKSRIPEPRHTTVLRWLDRYDLQRITIAFGCSMTRGRLVFRKSRKR